MCRERNADRGDSDARVPHEVFERMVAGFEAPQGRHISWEVNTWEVKQTTAIMEVMDALIQQARHGLKERRLAQIDAQKEAAQQVRFKLVLRSIIALTQILVIAP